MFLLNNKMMIFYNMNMNICEFKFYIRLNLIKTLLFSEKDPQGESESFVNSCLQESRQYILLKLEEKEGLK